MLPPNYLSYCTDEIEEIYSKLDTRITQDIVRRIIKTGEITDTAKWQVKMAQESGLLYDDIVQMVAESTGETEEAVKLLFEDAGIQATVIDYEKAGVLQRVDKLSPSALQILEAAIKKTNSSLSNLTMTTAEMAQNAFISACSMAEMEITSGAFDANTAIKHAVDMSIEEGNRIRYPSGVTRSVEAAVRTAVLTGVSQTTGHISLANAEALGTDIMQLSAHGGARPEHAVWQGKLVCISNKRRRGYLSLKDIGYGEITGFKGINCTHDWYPFIVGVSKRAYTKKELEEINNQTVTYNGKEMPLYEAQDLQRAMERKIRDERRQLASYDTAIKNTKNEALKQEFQGEFDILSVKLKSHEAKYRDFSNQTGMRPQTERLQVSGFGRSVSQKATNANKRHKEALNFIQNDAIIKQNSNLPKKLGDLPNETLKHTVNVSIDATKKVPAIEAIVPKGSELSKIEVMAGGGTSTSIRDLKRLYSLYGGKPEDWQKKSGTAYGKEFSYTIHWYENKGNIPIEEIKLKGVGKSK